MLCVLIQCWLLTARGRTAHEHTKHHDYNSNLFTAFSCKYLTTIEDMRNGGRERARRDSTVIDFALARVEHWVLFVVGLEEVQRGIAVDFNAKRRGRIVGGAVKLTELLTCVRVD